MLKTTVGRLAVNEALPEAYRDYSVVFDKKQLTAVLSRLASERPEDYREVTKKLADIGRNVAQATGGDSFGIRHMRKAQSAVKIRDRIRAAVRQQLNDEKLSDEDRNQRIIMAVGNAMEEQADAVYEESLAEKNPLALQILSGARGNKQNLASLRGSDLLYNDQRERVIPIPVLRSYSEGLTPAEYWAGSYGARRGVIATKEATRNAGYLAKQLAHAAHRLVVTAMDRDPETDDDGVPVESTVRGFPVDVGDEDSIGSLLATDIGGYKRHTTVSGKMLKDLKARGFDSLLVRSPAVGGSIDGGVYGYDVGVREQGGIPGRGTQVGLTAAQALSEPLSQSQLSAKHSGGVVGQEKGVSGFKGIDQLVQIPSTFKNGAAHAELDGIVDRIVPAVAGGHYVYINSQPHYVATDFAVNVKRGDRVEAGDVISEGAPNPAQVVKHKGIGEGRRYWVDTMRKAMSNAGIKANRRNLELLSRGLINHVQLTEEYEDFGPEDVVPYSTLEHLYKARADSRKLSLSEAEDKYLEKPVLHYSIGTKVRPSVLQSLAKFGVKDVTVHDKPPPFVPDMIRGAAVLQHDPDWMTRMYGSGLKTGLMEAAHTGRVSDPRGTSFVPGLARATEFGKAGPVKQPDPVVAPPIKAADSDLVDRAPTGTPAVAASAQRAALPAGDTVSRSPAGGGIRQARIPEPQSTFPSPQSTAAKQEFRPDRSQSATPPVAPAPTVSHQNAGQVASMADRQAGVLGSYAHAAYNAAIQHSKPPEPPSFQNAQAAPAPWYQQAQQAAPDPAVLAQQYAKAPDGSAQMVRPHWWPQESQDPNVDTMLPWSGRRQDEVARAVTERDVAVEAQNQQMRAQHRARLQTMLRVGGLKPEQRAEIESYLNPTLGTRALDWAAETTGLSPGKVQMGVYGAPPVAEFGLKATGRPRVAGAVGRFTGLRAINRIGGAMDLWDTVNAVSEGRGGEHAESNAARIRDLATDWQGVDMSGGKNSIGPGQLSTAGHLGMKALQGLNQFSPQSLPSNVATIGHTIGQSQQAGRDAREAALVNRELDAIAQTRGNKAMANVARDREALRQWHRWQQAGGDAVRSDGSRLLPEGDWMDPETKKPYTAAARSQFAASVADRATGGKHSRWMSAGSPDRAAWVDPETETKYTPEEIAAVERRSADPGGYAAADIQAKEQIRQKDKLEGRFEHTARNIGGDRAKTWQDSLGNWLAANP